MDQAIVSDRVMVARTRFAAEGQGLDWSLLFVPGGQAMSVLTLGPALNGTEPNARPGGPRDRPRPPEAVAETVTVAIGRWAVAAEPAAIRTLLGSCVGVVLYDRVARLGGVAHIVLPDSRGATEHPGRFADTAIPALIADIDRRARPRRREAGSPRSSPAGRACSRPAPP